jgi:glycosyltransferase|nr:GNA1162 family protein [uncultured Campylobacter sp.]
MKNKAQIAIFSVFVALFFNACALSEPEIYDYSALQQAKPRSILVLMPSNETTEVDAGAAVLANAIYPLSEAGYYVFSPALVHETFKNNGIYEASEIQNVSAHKLRQIFGADAVLYMDVVKYGTSYMLLNSVSVVVVNARLVDLRSGATLWEGSAQVSDDSSRGSNDLVGMLISAVIKQVGDTITDAGYKLSASADAILLGQNCNKCLLYGPYSPHYGQDRQLGGGK